MVTDSRHAAAPEWVFLLHRLPREPSAPRIALWRAIQRLGALLLGDGLVALPASARTVEHFEWLAAGIEEQGGSASVWLARPRLGETAARLVEESRAASEAEYRALMREASAVVTGDARRALRRLRGQLRRVAFRDHFGAPSAAPARAAIEALAERAAAVPA